MDRRDRELAVFEAGIKLGALYHQWVGTPVSRSTAASLETAIEQSVLLQPYIDDISVHLDRSLMSPNPFGYSELAGMMFEVEITTLVNGIACKARLRAEGDYPMMKVVSVHEAPCDPLN